MPLDPAGGGGNGNKMDMEKAARMVMVAKKLKEKGVKGGLLGDLLIFLLNQGSSREYVKYPDQRDLCGVMYLMLDWDVMKRRIF